MKTKSKTAKKAKKFQKFQKVKKIKKIKQEKQEKKGKKVKKVYKKWKEEEMTVPVQAHKFLGFCSHCDFCISSKDLVVGNKDKYFCLRCDKEFKVSGLKEKLELDKPKSKKEYLQGNGLGGESYIPVKVEIEIKSEEVQVIEGIHLPDLEEHS